MPGGVTPWVTAESACSLPTRTWARISSSVIRPSEPLGRTRRSSTPNSRAKRRTAGPAAAEECPSPGISTVDAGVGAFAIATGAGVLATGAARAGVGAAAVGAGSGAGGVGVGWGTGSVARSPPAEAGSPGVGRVVAVAASISRIAAPILRVSPSLTRIFSTLPAVGLGTGIVALSVSISTMSWSTVIVSPSFTNSDNTSPDSIFSPKLGSVICVAMMGCSFQNVLPADDADKRRSMIEVKNHQRNEIHERYFEYVFVCFVSFVVKVFRRTRRRFFQGQRQGLSRPWRLFWCRIFLACSVGRAWR